MRIECSKIHDDGEEDSNGAMDLGSSDLELIQESTEQDVGIRFRDIPIAQNANIVSATEFSAAGIGSPWRNEPTDSARITLGRRFGETPRALQYRQ